jgi:hypothetical protein
LKNWRSPARQWQSESEGAAPIPARGARPVRRPLTEASHGPGETVWHYTITIPLEEIRPHKRQRATGEDLNKLELMFNEHFGGFTRLPNSPGSGLRDPTDPSAAPEMNFNAYFVVLASPVPEADAYFRALREELETALDEGVILVERQEAWIP